MKKCPFCAEEIQADAIKYIHCGEFIVASTYSRFAEENNPSSPFLKHTSLSLHIVVTLSLCLILISLSLSFPTQLIADDKPLLSEAIAKEIDAHGVADATEKFAKAFEKDKDAYTVDMDGIANLGTKYMQANNFEASGAVMQIAAPYMQTAIKSMTRQYSSAMSKTMDEKVAEEKVQKKKYLKRERERQKQLDREQKRDLSAAKGEPEGKPLINENISYSATSSLVATNPDGRRHSSTLSINHTPRKVRYAKPETRSEPVSIFRYDKGVLWLVHPEHKGYEGVKLYQEFKLTSGKGINGHIDTLLFARKALLSPKGLINLGKKTVDGHSVTHYYKKERNLGYEYGNNSYDYWVDDNGIMVKMQIIAPEVSRTLQTRDIKLSSQDKMLFVPPADYRKAGHIISWKDEKQKIDAK